MQVWQWLAGLLQEFPHLWKVNLRELSFRSAVRAREESAVSLVAPVPPTLRTERARVGHPFCAAVDSLLFVA